MNENQAIQGCGYKVPGLATVLKMQLRKTLHDFNKLWIWSLAYTMQVSTYKLYNISPQYNSCHNYTYSTSLSY